MIINDNEIFEETHRIIKELFGDGASFREGQYEAIEATMTRERTLVVQRTGWGKSLVYFVCTKLLRERKKGPTIVVSPLLILMKNQLESARRLGLSCDVLNRTSIERHEQILDSLRKNELDLVLITPETLFKDEIREVIDSLDIGLFVIDEAHCISDWGHDFRLEYGRLREIVSALDSDTPVLATTATASNRVIRDLETQLGTNTYVSRGPLSRDSLSIQVLNMPSRVERYAWILENISKLEGSGIIYCLTKRDCDYLADFLNKNGINAMAYYSERGKEEHNLLAEEKFEKNEIKAIVATIKLGMGYDKGDIAFVIHYQMPSNIVAYYQQIGRAGRSIENANVFLMYGKEDMTIVNYFIDIIFPPREDVENVLSLISNAKKGMRARTIEATLNISKKRIERTLELLESEGAIIQKNHAYYLGKKPFVYDGERYEAITAMRRQEARQMYELSTHGGCLSKYIVNCIDDFTAGDCGKCANCRRAPILSEKTSLESKEIASRYINGLVFTIQPRKMWLGLDELPSSKIEHVNSEGICLSQYGEVGYGEIVKRDREDNNRYSDELVGKSAELLRDVIREKSIKYLTFVPSGTDKIRDFANRLAKVCKLEVKELLYRLPSPRQSEMENGAHKCANAYNSFEIKGGIDEIIDTCRGEALILVDDVVDSRWTLTACGYRLMQAGASEVVPFVLADNSNEQ